MRDKLSTTTARPPRASAAMSLSKMAVDGEDPYTIKPEAVAPNVSTADWPLLLKNYDKCKLQCSTWRKAARRKVEGERRKAAWQKVKETNDKDDDYDYDNSFISRLTEHRMQCSFALVTSPPFPPVAHLSVATSNPTSLPVSLT